MTSVSYFVIGLDGKPHGPLSIEDLQVWIADGRASRYSRVRVDGETAWRGLQDLAEFAGSFKKPAAFQISPEEAPAEETRRPAGDSHDLAEMAANYALHARKVDAGASFRRAWNLVSGRFIELAGWSALIGLIEILLVQVTLAAWAQVTHTAESTAASAAPSITDFQVSPAVLPLLIVNGVLTGVLTGVLSFIYLNAIRGRRVRVSELWAAVTATMGQLLLTVIAQILLTFIGVFPLVVPGVYLAVAYVFAPLLAIDKRLSFWSALEVSRRVVSRQWWAMALVFLLCAALLLIGSQLPYGIGIVLLMPIYTAAMMYTYEDLFGA